MAGRLTRFLNLERPRRPGEAPHHEVATTARFKGEPSGMALEKDHGEQPFLRCPRCEADNSRFERRCINCQAPLDGEDVRDWNEKLWAARRAQAAQERAQVAQRHAQRTLTEEELLQQNRMLGEALAREIGERERVRLGWGSTGFDDSTPIGVRLLSLLPTTSARVMAGLIIGGVFLGCAVLAYSGPRHSPLRIAGFVVDLVLVLLFSPNVPRYRRWWW
jgi:hypothetical protein